MASMHGSIAKLALVAAVGCGPARWVSGEADDLANAYWFTARGVAIDTVLEVTCRSTELADEVHFASGSARRGVVVYGLLADHSYDCALDAGLVIERHLVTTPPLPDGIPSMTVSGQTEGYTVFNSGRDDGGTNAHKLLIVDPEGRVRWYSFIDKDVRDVDVTWLAEEQHLLVGGGYVVPPRRMRLDGSIVARAGTRLFESFHHHVEQRPDGTVLVLLENTISREGRSWEGFRVEVIEADLRGTVWSWDSSRGVDDGWLETRTGTARDLYHANALDEDEHTVFVSLRQVSRVAAIDRETGELRYQLGQGGDFTLLDPDGEVASNTEWFFGQHTPKFRGNRVLVHDNGWTRPEEDRASRVVEYELDVERRQATVVWSWSEPGWYEPIWGDVDWLADGHVLITRAHCARCTPSTTPTQLVEVDPATDDVTWRLVLDDPDDTGYRAQRVDGCSIFANQAVCPGAGLR